MKSFMHFVSWSMMLAGFYAILWPLPAFLLNEKLGTAYLNFIWRLPPDDKSAGAALPFVWLFLTAPIGFMLLLLSFGVDTFTGWVFKK